MFPVMKDRQRSLQKDGSQPLVCVEKKNVKKWVQSKVAENAKAINKNAPPGVKKRLTVRKCFRLCMKNSQFCQISDSNSCKLECTFVQKCAGSDRNQLVSCPCSQIKSSLQYSPWSQDISMWDTILTGPQINKKQVLRRRNAPTLPGFSSYNFNVGHVSRSTSNEQGT